MEVTIHYDEITREEYEKVLGMAKDCLDLTEMKIKEEEKIVHCGPSIQNQKKCITHIMCLTKNNVVIFMKIRNF